MACVPTEMALSEPPNIHSRMRDGSSAAWAFDDSGHGIREKKTMSISLTTLWVSIARTVGAARRRMTRYGEPSVATRGAVPSAIVTIRGGGESGRLYLRFDDAAGRRRAFLQPGTLTATVRAMDERSIGTRAYDCPRTCRA